MYVTNCISKYCAYVLSVLLEPLLVNKPFPEAPLILLNLGNLCALFRFSLGYFVEHSCA